MTAPADTCRTCRNSRWRATPSGRVCQQRFQGECIRLHSAAYATLTPGQIDWHTPHAAAECPHFVRWEGE